MEKIEKILLLLIFLGIFVVFLFILKPELSFRVELYFRSYAPTTTIAKSMTITITTTTTTPILVTTTLSCILSKPKIIPNCSKDCCQLDDKIFISGELNGAPICKNVNSFQIDAQGEECKIKFSNGDISGITSNVEILPPYNEVLGTWKIKDIHPKCFGKTVSAEDASLWYNTPENGTKISQSPNPKALGKISFCPSKKIIHAEESICSVEYGKISCFYERVILPLYNPNENITLRNVYLTQKISDGKEIHSKIQDIKPNETKVLILENLKCPLKEKIKEENFMLTWCCSKKSVECYKMSLAEEEAGVTRIVELADITSNISKEEEIYPLHPTLENCENLRTHVKNFCYDDVAELTGEEKICEKILDDDIKKHCIARATLNSSICLQIKDEDLRRGCIDSVEMKRRWLNETKS